MLTSKKSILLIILITYNCFAQRPFTFKHNDVVLVGVPQNLFTNKTIYIGNSPITPDGLITFGANSSELTFDLDRGPSRRPLNRRTPPLDLSHPNYSYFFQDNFSDLFGVFEKFEDVVIRFDESNIEKISKTFFTDFLNQIYTYVSGPNVCIDKDSLNKVYLIFPESQFEKAHSFFSEKKKLLSTEKIKEKAYSKLQVELPSLKKSAFILDRAHPTTMHFKGYRPSTRFEFSKNSLNEHMNYLSDYLTTYGKIVGDLKSGTIKDNSYSPSLSQLRKSQILESLLEKEYQAREGTPGFTFTFEDFVLYKLKSSKNFNSLETYFPLIDLKEVFTTYVSKDVPQGTLSYHTMLNAIFPVLTWFENSHRITTVLHQDMTTGQVHLFEGLATEHMEHALSKKTKMIGFPSTVKLLK